MNRIYVLTIFLFTLALVSYSFIEWLDDDEQQSNLPSTLKKPTFIANNLESDIFAETGELSYHVKAKKMEHYAQSKTTLFQEPRYILFPKNNKPAWKVTAKEGILANNNRITLKNRVDFTSTNDESLIKAIKGQYIEMDLTTNIISSEQTILILGEGFTMYGSGLIVDLNTSQMTITEHVQTIYKPYQK